MVPRRPVIRPVPVDDSGFTVEPDRAAGGFVVSGARPERWIGQTNFDNDEAVGYLADRLARLGCRGGAAAAGCAAGVRGDHRRDDVRLGAANAGRRSGRIVRPRHRRAAGTHRSRRRRRAQGRPSSAARARRRLVSAHREAIRTARSLVVKVGTNALTTPIGSVRRRPVGRTGRRDRGADEGGYRRRHRVLRRHRRRHRSARIVPSSKGFGDQAGSRQRRAGGAGEFVERGVRPLWPHGRAGAADRTRHFDAGSAHQRPAHPGSAARAACGGDRQRERHGGHQRDPVR